MNFKEQSVNTHAQKELLIVGSVLKIKQLLMRRV